MGFMNRIAALRPGLAVGINANNLDFWGIMFGRPVAFAILTVIGDISWLTPNILTHFSNIFLVAGALLILKDTAWAFVAAAILLNLGMAFDCADGQLARYRKNGSLLGSYYDKVSDYFGMMLMYSTLSWVVFARTQEPLYFILALVGVASNMMTGYTKWILAAHDVPEGPAPKAGNLPKPLTGGLLALRIAAKIFEFRELDMFLWIGIGLCINRPELGLIIMGISQPIAAISASIYRGVLITRKP